MKKKYIYFHFFFLFIFLLYYILNFFFFNSLTTFYHDNLDGIVVYNKIIGDIYSNKINNTDIFLGGEIKFYYLRHFFKPFILIYAIFDAELAYYFTEIILKLIAYFSFFLLSKKLNNNFLTNTLCSALFASALPFSTMGFGLASMPYFIYLISFKKKLGAKHYLTIIFLGLNTDLIAELFFVPVCLGIAFIINNNFFKNNLKNLCIIALLFLLASLLTSLNMAFVTLLEEENTRIEFKKETYFLKTIINEFFTFLNLPNELNWTLAKKLPLAILLLPTFIIVLFSKSEKAKKIFWFIIFIHLLNILFSSNFFGSIKSYLPVFKYYRFSWMLIYLNILYVLLIFHLFLEKNNKFLLYLSLTSLLLFQTNTLLVPFIKKNISKEENYRNIYTFKGYYIYDDYKKIKNIVGEKRVLSLGYDPMIAVMNGIKTIDGYHAMYPLRYKKQFYQVIKKEVEKDEFIKDYYLKWGSRVYAFVIDQKNIDINFLEAKKIGAEYIISKFKLDSLDLTNIDYKFENSIFLYKIN